MPPLPRPRQPNLLSTDFKFQQENHEDELQALADELDEEIELKEEV
ncbi:MAG: hypothetical protein IPK55_13085 [Streptococcus sp.]|nr:hypothetical protein [Streptococcus sp.]